MISKAFVWWLIIATILLLGGFYGVSLMTHIPVVLYIATIAFSVMTFLLYKNKQAVASTTGWWQLSL